MWRRLFIALFLVLSPLSAEEPSNEVFTPPFAKEGEGYNYWGEFVNMLLSLLVILALIFGSVWFLKRMMRTRLRHLNRSKGIKILERRPLNPKASLYLVEVLGKGLVIAESQAGIHLLSEFPHETNIEELLATEQEETEARPSLFENLQRKLRRPRPVG